MLGGKVRDEAESNDATERGGRTAGGAGGCGGAGALARGVGCVQLTSSLFEIELSGEMMAHLR
jgi:hypothetical protein